MPVRVYVGVGSNVDRFRNIRSGVSALRQRFGPLRLSRVYDSAAVGFEGADFFNLVVGFDSDEPIWQIASALRDIEGLHRRRRCRERFAPRTLDLDLLLYGDQVYREEGIQVPRDEILSCAFVLRPLVDIAPDQRHPLVGRSFAELWQELEDSGQRLSPVSLKL